MLSIFMALALIIGIILFISAYKTIHFSFLWFSPIIITMLCLLWAAITRSYTTYNNHSWASVPIYFVLPINLLLHLIIIISIRDQKIINILYTIIHLIITFSISILSLMLVTHDSL